jgi:putative ABC transport system substrate-binding protein
MGPFAGFAQQRRSPRRIGVLFMLLSPEGKEARAFKQALQESGYVEGRDVVIEWHFAKADYARLPGLAAELVQHNVDVIIADTGPAAQAVRQATSSIPIVMTIVADPFGSGLIASLARPGGNVTGLSIMLAELSAKRLQLLKDALPRITRVAVLWHPATPYHTKALDDLKATAPSMAIELSFIDIRAPEQIDAGFRAAGRTRAQAIFVLDCPLFFTHRTTLVGLASKSSLPLISGEQPYADAGGLLTYGPDYADQMRRSAGYVDKIFKGAKPGDLPVEQPIKFDLVINLKTAKALDIKISNSILLRANRVIE